MLDYEVLQNYLITTVKKKTLFFEDADMSKVIFL